MIGMIVARFHLDQAPQQVVSPIQDKDIQNSFNPRESSP